MQDNELIEILKEFDEKRVGQLNDNARNLFYAIMEIANQRDRLLEENRQLKNNWKSLKKWLKFRIDATTRDISRILLKSILANVKEIEKSDK